MSGGRKKRIFEVIQIGFDEDWQSRTFDVLLLCMIVVNLAQVCPWIIRSSTRINEIDMFFSSSDQMSSSSSLSSVASLIDAKASCKIVFFIAGMP